jgi:hypothetical protein
MKQIMKEIKRQDDSVLNSWADAPIVSSAVLTLFLPFFRNANPISDPTNAIRLPQGKDTNMSAHSSQHMIAFSRDR